MKPNTAVCPVCTGQPGALPVLQLEPVQKALLLARALHCSLNNPSQFDRKSYFYPDLPTGYQITQYFTPYAVKGQLAFFSEDYSQEYSVALREAHMEIDSGKTIHDGENAFVDFNRSGTPLVEVVTEPDFRSADEVINFLKELQRIVRYNDIGDADMEKGQLRVDVNLSVRQAWSPLGTKVEMKNMNSFSAIRKAIEKEYSRQVSVISWWGKIEQETRWWDEGTQDSFVMRSKEDALEYRYFPEPDLPPLLLSEKLLDEMKEAELIIPFDVISHYRDTYGFHKEYINVLIGSVAMYRYFHQVIQHGFDPHNVAKWLSWPIAGYLNESFVDVDQLPFDQGSFEDFLGLIEKKEINDHQAKVVMTEMLATGLSPRVIVKEKGFDQSGVDGGQLTAFVEKVLSDNVSVVEQYHHGKESVMWFLVGQVMRVSKGQADPLDVKEEVKRLLNS